MSGLVSGSQFSCGPSPLPFIRGNPCCCSRMTRLGLKLPSEQYGAAALIKCDWSSDQFSLITSPLIFHVGGWGSLRVMLVVMAAKCGWCQPAGRGQDRAEVFPDILCSRVRWCVLVQRPGHAWPPRTLQTAIIPDITAITGQTGPGRNFPQNLCFMSRVRFSSHSL